MSEYTAKALASVAMCAVIVIGAWKTESAWCLWALLLVAVMWGHK